MPAGWRLVSYRRALPGLLLQRRVQFNGSEAAALARRSSTSSTPSPSSSSTAPDELRQLMRKVAQPVAVITVNLHDPSNDGEPDHGATISSFVSIALAPVPLVSFALRLPSRLASYLDLVSPSPSTSTSTSTFKSSNTPTFKIHLLSADQEDAARAFARQAPLPHKPVPSSSSSSHISTGSGFSKELFDKLDASSLGTLECSIAGSARLADPLRLSSSSSSSSKSSGGASASTTDALDAEQSKAGQATSQLFIAKVHSVKNGDPSLHPLLYYHQNYLALGDEHQ